MAAGGLLGCFPLMKMKERIRVLDVVTEELKFIRAELHTYGLSIPELMGRMQTSMVFSTVGDIIEQYGAMAFSEGWKDCVTKFGEHLTPQERQATEGLGDILGRYALEEQVRAIDEAVELLLQGKMETVKRLREVSRLYMGTSLSLSAMLVVLLL